MRKVRKLFVVFNKNDFRHSEQDIQESEETVEIKASLEDETKEVETIAESGHPHRI